MRTIIAIALGLTAVTCSAHNGPPFPIITDRPMSGCVISLWTHPDVGIGTFFVAVSPKPGQPLPKGLRFDIGVAPVSGRLNEARYPTERGEDNRGGRLNEAVPVDR